MDQMKAMMDRMSDEDLAAMFSADPELLTRVMNALLTAADQGGMPGAGEEGAETMPAGPHKMPGGEMMGGGGMMGGGMGERPASPPSRFSRKAAPSGKRESALLTLKKMGKRRKMTY